MKYVLIVTLAICFITVICGCVAPMHPPMHPSVVYVRPQPNVVYMQSDIVWDPYWYWYYPAPYVVREYPHYGHREQPHGQPRYEQHHEQHHK